MKVQPRAKLELGRLDRIRRALNPPPREEPTELRRDDLEWLVAAYATLRHKRMAEAIGWEQR